MAENSAGPGRFGSILAHLAAERNALLDKNRVLGNNIKIHIRMRKRRHEYARHCRRSTRQKLEALPGTDITRPTLDQVKEAMFSIVQFDLPGARVLDLYAGSGQLGIEALSRGAARCVFLDENREAVNIVMKNCKTCGVFDRSRVNIGEAARYLSACHEQFDLVLLDPPFRGGTLEKILPSVDKCVAPGGIVLCESETGLVLPAEVGGLTLKKQYKYGKVLLWKYTKPQQPAGEEDAE